MNLIHLLASIYHTTDLKQNIEFDIKLLCLNLKLDLEVNYIHLLFVTAIMFNIVDLCTACFIPPRTISLCSSFISFIQNIEYTYYTLLLGVHTCNLTDKIAILIYQYNRVIT
jgi:hypothetical protein